MAVALAVALAESLAVALAEPLVVALAGSLAVALGEPLALALAGSLAVELAGSLAVELGESLADPEPVMPPVAPVAAILLACQLQSGTTGGSADLAAASASVSHAMLVPALLTRGSAKHWVPPAQGVATSWPLAHLRCQMSPISLTLIILAANEILPDPSCHRCIGLRCMSRQLWSRRTWHSALGPPGH